MTRGRLCVYIVEEKKRKIKESSTIQSKENDRVIYITLRKLCKYDKYK